MAERRFHLFADFHQFLLHDAGVDWRDLSDRWTDDSIAAMFVQGDGYVAVRTARDMVVPVTIKTFPTEPALVEEGWDKLVRGALNVPTGELVVTGVTDNELSGGRIKLNPGRYELRALWAGLSEISAHGLSGNDRYEIQLWPALPSDVGP